MVKVKVKRRIAASRKVAPKTRIAKVMMPRKSLDAAAAAYARLLSDPCNAPLCHPIYPGTESGFLFRAENFANIADPGAGATTTAGIWHWTPGYVNADSTELVFINSATASAAQTVVATTNSPGKSFLAANARGVRCIAACMRITFIGSESTRAGRLHVGHTTAGMIDVGQSVSVDQVAQTLQYFSRTPTDTVELIWKPNLSDVNFQDPSAGSSPVIRDQHSAITMAVAGLPTGTGMTIHMTAIYEWTPAVALGVGHNALGKARSVNTLDEVQDTLIERGFAYVRGAAFQAGMGLGSGVMAALGQTYGLMPANLRRTGRYPRLSG